MSAPQRSPEWHAARAELSVTGSMAGMVLDFSPYGDYQTALRNKFRECVGLPPDRPMTDAMRKGVDMEQTAREAYEKHTGNLVTDTGLHQWAQIPWLGSSPDGIMDDRCLEIKIRNTPKPISERKWEWVQCQLHMTCTGKDLCDYWQWNESGGVLETVEFDHDFWADHGETLTQFHEDLQAILADEKLQKPFREPLVEQRTDPEWREAEAAYLEVKAMQEAANDAEKKARAVLMTLANNKACEGPGVKVTPFERQGTINWNHPDIVDALFDAGIDADQYRKPPTTQTRITVK